MTIKQIKELRSQYNEAVTEMRGLVDKAEKEGRGLNSDEQAKWAAADQRADGLKGRIETLQRTLERGAELEQSEGLSTRGAGNGGQQGEQRGGEQGGEQGDNPLAGADYRQSFNRWMRGGMDGVTGEQRNLLLQHRGQLDPREMRDLSVGTPAAGGFTVAQDFFNRLTEAQRAFGGMTQVAEIITTATGATLPMPTEDDTANVATIVGENTSNTTSVDATFGATNMGAFTYRTLTRVSIELLQDSAFDIEGYLARKFGERFARGMNAHFTVGTGTGQPQGLAHSSGAAVGRTGTTGQTTTVTWDDLVLLEHSVDPAYRRNAAFMWHDNTLRAVKLLKDSQNRPIWLPDYATSGGNFPATVLGYRYVINQDMPTMSANARSISFGDHSAYKVRMVSGMMMLRLQERFIDFGQIGFIGFMRADGRYLGVGNPVRVYVNSAT